MLPFNIGLPKTPHGTFLDRCHEPCPSAIPTLINQGSTETSKSKPDVTSTPAQSRLLLPGVCHGGEAKAASPVGRLH